LAARAKRNRYNRNAFERAAHGNQRIFFTGGLLRRCQALFVFFYVFKFQTVNGLNISGQLFTAFSVEKNIQALTRAQTQMVIAFGTYIKVLFQLRPVKHRIAFYTFFPQTFRHLIAALLTFGAHHAGNNFF
jgi:hypothetical protein